LTGKYETQSIDKFSWGISDRGASIRVPQATAENWKGYVEDRRPGSNADPYKIIYEIVESIKNAETLDEIKHKMNFKANTEEIAKKYNGVLSNEDLLKEYQNDDDYQLDSEVMIKNKNNISSKEINFNMNYGK
jgi:glutamine synthetase